jgi:predicted pyridoxine 5'-phosphate oxidase superfamily flavin-nucleotide-binding protein
MIPEALHSALQGTFPSALSTVDNDGNPNVSMISQVFFVDSEHVALSNQFFNKSMRNIQMNGRATVNIIQPADLKSYYMYLEHVESQKEGPVFEQMSMELEAIASMTGMQDVFKLKASEIFKVIEIVEVP